MHVHVDRTRFIFKVSHLQPLIHSSEHSGQGLVTGHLRVRMTSDGEEGANPINPSHPGVGCPLLEGTIGSESDNFSIGSAADITLASLNKMGQNRQPLTTHFCVKPGLTPCTINQCTSPASYMIEKHSRPRSYDLSLSVMSAPGSIHQSKSHRKKIINACLYPGLLAAPSRCSGSGEIAPHQSICVPKELRRRRGG